MASVLSGFFVITVIVVTGIGVGRSGILGPQGRFVLNRLCYFVGAPALVFTSLVDSDLSVVLSTNFGIAAVAALVTGAVGAVIARGVLHRSAADTIVTATSGALVNSANMGFPIAAYVLGDVAYALPVALLQMALLTPGFQFLLHSAVAGQRPSLRSFAANIAANPMIIGSALGLSVLLTGWRPPSWALEPVQVVAATSIPCMLIAFGMSLTASRPFSKEAGVRADIVLATVLKLAVMPLVAFACARWAFGVSGHELYQAVVLAALPTAQNVYVAAARYEVGEDVARDSALFTSLGTVVILMGLSVVLGS